MEGRRLRNRPRALARVAAAALLSVIASFALTIASDPCSGDSDCAGRPCHILCTDGCTTTPVPALHVDAAPRTARHVVSLDVRPLAPPAPDLDAVDRPPRTLA